jgi:fatty acid desaturase
MWDFLREKGLVARWRALRKPRAARLFLVATIDWLAIAGAFFAFLNFGLVAAPFSLLVIGNRQRALGNLLHDAAHGNCRTSGRAGDAIAEMLLFLPMWNAMRKYRREHFAHHCWLGDPTEDVDFIHRESDRGGSWVVIWLRLAQDPRVIASSTFAHLWRSEPSEAAAMLAFTAAALSAMLLALGPAAPVEFLVLWLAARATVFHAITTFREISDHAGLQPGSVLGFSRNHVGRGPLAILFHPHDNGLHLVHHLDPALPFWALREAHEILMGWPAYAAATHTTRYFGGDRALVRSWVGDGAVSASSR